MNVTIKHTLDLKGLSCPMPIVKTAKAMKELSSGDIVEVFATDPGSVPDFKAWCTATRNELIEQDESNGVYRYTIKKR
jgi:tRNA 2-thiouridine synthesizing protein A